MATSGLAPVGPAGKAARGRLGARHWAAALRSIVARRWFRVALCLLGLATAPLIVLPVVADRVEALDGRLRVWSPTGAGHDSGPMPCAQG